MSKLYHEDFLKMFKDSPNYVHFDDQWRWQIPLPEKVDLEWMGEALGEYLENQKAPEYKGLMNSEPKEFIDEVNRWWQEASNTEGIVRKSEEAPTSISTDPHQWMTDKEIHEEKFWGSRQHCSYCDYTPCRCKNEDYGK